MKRFLYFICLTAFVILWSSCRDDFNFKPSTGQIAFSKDTVYLDTIFTNISSGTYNLRVYNLSDDDIVIPSVRLGRGETSEYRLNVDGIPGKVFENVQLLARDSMYVFIETTIDYNNFTNPDDNYLYTDQIIFDSGVIQQDVDLVTLVQDANFIYPDKDNTTNIIETLTVELNGETIETTIQGRYLEPSELNFTNDKPYVVYGYAAVPNGETLTVDAGARIHFHANSGLFVGENASLQVNGMLSTDQDILDNEVIFEGDRLEPAFADVPGQWGGIILSENSTNNVINYTTIKNATVGIRSDANPNTDSNVNKLTISNSKIFNSSNFGILGRNTSIKADNVVINNSGQVSFAGTLGGKYNFTHCTIANYWDSGFRQFPALLLNNFVIDNDNNAFLADLSAANFNNCIIYGNDNPEFLVDEIEDSAVAFNFKFTNCLMRFDNSSNTLIGPNYNLTDVSKYDNVIFNQDPLFMNTETNDFRIGNNSPAVNSANAALANEVPFDILNVSRLPNPDIGAYEFIPE